MILKKEISIFAAILYMASPNLALGSQCGAPVATDPSFQELLWNILSGVPDVPRYPGSLLIGSSIQNPKGMADTGYRIKWVTSDSVGEVIKWSRKHLPLHGWKVDPEDVPLESGDITDGIRNESLDGYFGATGHLDPEQCTEITFSVQYK